MTDRPKPKACTPLAERRVVHRVPPGAAVAADGALARLFGVALIEELDRRRAERAQAAFFCNQGE